MNRYIDRYTSESSERFPGYVGSSEAGRYHSDGGPTAQRATL